MRKPTLKWEYQRNSLVECNYSKAYLGVLTSEYCDVSQTAGRSAIFYGAEDGNLEIVKLLIQGGAKLSLKDKVSAV